MDCCDMIVPLPILSEKLREYSKWDNENILITDTYGTEDNFIKNIIMKRSTLSCLKIQAHILC